jgi:hypothetical protein
MSGKTGVLVTGHQSGRRGSGRGAGLLVLHQICQTQRVQRLLGQPRGLVVYLGAVDAAVAVRMWVAPS